MLFNDPKTSRKRFAVKDIENASNDPKDMRAALIGQPQHDQTWVILARKVANVREIEVHGDDGPSFDPTYVSDSLIDAAAHALIVNGHRVVTPGPQRLRHVIVQVLVNLEQHHAAPGVSGTIRSRASSAA